MKTKTKIAEMENEIARKMKMKWRLGLYRDSI